MKRDRLYQLNLELTEALKDFLKDATEEQVSNALGSYLQMMTAPENAEIVMNSDEMKQTGLLCAITLSRLLQGKLTNDFQATVALADNLASAAADLNVKSVVLENTTTILSSEGEESEPAVG